MSLSLGLGLALTRNKGGGARGALRLAGNALDVVAIDFTTGKMVIRDSAAPSKDYTGGIAGKLTITGSLTPTAKGAYFDASNYASLATALIPYSGANLTARVKFRPNFNGNPAANAQVLFVDNGGNDRFALYYPTANPPRFNYGDGAANITIASTATVVDTVYEMIAAAGAEGGRLFVGETAVASSPSNALAASTPANVFFGTSGAGAQPLNGWIESIVIRPRYFAPRISNATSVMSQAVRSARPLPDDRRDRIVQAIGDSHTYNAAYGLTGDQFYVGVIRGRLGGNWYWDNLGDSGDTTAEMMSRRTRMAEPGTPEILIIYGGINDAAGTTTVQASPAPTTTTFSVATGLGTRYAAGGWLKVGGVSAQVLSVAADAITLTAALGAAPAAGDAVTIDTQKNLVALAAYATSLGIAKVAICGMHYLNWATSGDTTSAQRPAEAALRVIQAAAAVEAGVPFVNLYEWMRQLILAGTYTQGDDLAWHVAIGDQHLNVTGERILGEAITDTIVAQGWA